MKILILAGGRGTRLWPLSRKVKPKQFQKLAGKETMLQETVARFLPDFSPRDIFVSTNKEYLAEALKELPGLLPSHVIAEPFGRERVAAILFFIGTLDKSDYSRPLLVAPSDHVIKDKNEFLRVAAVAAKFVASNPDYIVTLGAKPAFPDTGLGYCKIGRRIEKIDGLSVYAAALFKEKPNLKRTRIYLADGRYYWNTGIYVFCPQLFEELAEKFVFDNFKRSQNIKKARQKNDTAVIESEYGQMDAASVEYSIIENYQQVALIPADFGWSDVGSWSVLKNSLAAPDKNYVKGNYVGIDSKNVMVLGSQERLVAGVGIKDLIIVVTDDIILVCNNEDSQKVKRVIQKLEKNKKFNYI